MFSSNNNSDLKSIGTLYYRAVRNLFLTKYNAHIPPLLKSASLLDFQDLLDYNNSVFAYKYKKGMLPKTFNNIFSYFKDNSGDVASTRVREADGNLIVDKVLEEKKIPIQLHT